MIALIRLYPGNKEDAQEIWKYIEERVGNAPRKGIKSLFISMQSKATFVSLFVQAEDVEIVGDLLVNEIGGCKHIVDTRTFPLLKFAFLPTPKKKVEKAKRYSIMIKTKPSKYYRVYKEVLDIRPSQDAFIGFVGFLLGDYDVLVSLVSNSQKRAEEFARDRLSQIKGVEDIRIFPIKKSQLLISLNEWRMFQRALLFVPSWITDEIKDEFAFGSYMTDEDIHLSGAMKDEA